MWFSKSLITYFQKYLEGSGGVLIAPINQTIKYLVGKLTKIQRRGFLNQPWMWYDFSILKLWMYNLLVTFTKRNDWTLGLLSTQKYTSISIWFYWQCIHRYRNITERLKRTRGPRFATSSICSKCKNSSFIIDPTRWAKYDLKKYSVCTFTISPLSPPKHESI